MEKYLLIEGQIYNCIDYANEIFEPVKILENNPITGDIAYIVISTNESIYFSGQGCFNSLENQSLEC